MITLAQIQKKLSEAIQNSGLTQTHIAAQLGISQQTVSHYKNGDITPVLDIFANLCKVLDVSADDILCIDD